MSYGSMNHEQKLRQMRLRQWARRVDRVEEFKALRKRLYSARRMEPLPAGVRAFAWRSQASDWAWEEAYRRMTEPMYMEDLPASAFEGRDCEYEESLCWAHGNLNTPNVSASACPGPSAWSMLRDARGDPQIRRELYRQMARLLPRSGGGGGKGGDEDSGALKFLGKVAGDGG